MVVFIVNVEDPDPAIVDGLNPPLVTPDGNPPSLLTLNVTLPVNPCCGVIVTV